MTTTGTTATTANDRPVAIFAETNFGVEPAIGTEQQDRDEAEERARAWRAILKGNLL